MRRRTTVDGMANGEGVLLVRDHIGHHLERAAERGELHRIRRGAYRRGPAAQEWQARREDALARIAALSRQLQAPFVVSHASAALWWDLASIGDLSVTHIIQRSRASSRSDPRVVRHTDVVAGGDVVYRHGVWVTSLERTAVDCARTCRATDALVAVDAALRAGADRALMAQLLRPGHRGVLQARRTLERADPGAESPAESIVRHHLITGGLVPLRTQIPVETHRGAFRIDLGWPSVRVGVEFDGRLKYRGAPAPEHVLYREKLRHDAIVEQGWLLLHLAWPDLSDPLRLCQRARALIRRQLATTELGTSRQKSPGRVPISG